MEFCASVYGRIWHDKQSTRNSHIHDRSLSWHDIDTSIKINGWKNKSCGNFKLLIYVYLLAFLQLLIPGNQGCLPLLLEFRVLCSHWNINLFSPWYSWKIAKVAFNNNQWNSTSISLYVYPWQCIPKTMLSGEATNTKYWLLSCLQ
jgi:hypothetical protein